MQASFSVVLVNQVLQVYICLTCECNLALLCLLTKITPLGTYLLNRITLLS